MAELCALCRKPPAKGNRLATHHVQGRKKNTHMPTMRVHEGACHRFADWITVLYKERGILDDLKAEHVVYYFTRVASVRDEGVFILPIY
jgi:hypothetical protein